MMIFLKLKVQLHEQTDCCLFREAQIVINADLSFRLGIYPILKHYSIPFFCPNGSKEG